MDKNIMSISFVISSDKLSPDEITKLLNISPTKAWKKGDKYNSKYKASDGTINYREATRPWGIWELSSSDDTSSSNLDDHATKLIRRLEPSINQVKKLLSKSDFRVSINIWWQPEDGYGGYTIQADTMKKLTMLCKELDFYFS